MENWFEGLGVEQKLHEEKKSGDEIIKGGLLNGGKVKYQGENMLLVRKI